MNVGYELWHWLVFFAIVFAALFVDIGIVNRKSHAPSRKETVIWSCIWVSIACLFGGFVFWELGAFKAKEFFTGYLIELSLSIDNLFVFLLIFGFFKVPKKYQHRALFWGIFMALVLRMVMIFAGAGLVERFEWILYIFGVFLIYTGIKMFGDDESFDPEDSQIVRLTTRFIPISNRYDGDKFFTPENGRQTGTLLFLVLIVINVADLVFAVDSIPAIFGITTDRYIVYTSNIFAILGLRTFYFLLAEMADRFHYLKYGLAFILSFIGVKMLLPLLAVGVIMVMGDSHSAFADFVHRFHNGDFKQEFVNISLGIVAGTMILSVVISVVFPPSVESKDAELKDMLDQ
ncbi:MAG: TerC family protein [Pyrinomonadaceae bacterium]